MTSTADAGARSLAAPSLTRLTVVITVFMASGAFPAFALGVLGPFIVTDFGLTRAELGLLMTAMYLVGGLVSISAGSIVDRLGPRTVMLGGFTLTAATLAGMAWSPSYGVLVALAGVAGLAMAAGNPATNKAVASAVPPSRRGVVIGIKQAGVQAGAFIAGATLPAVAQAVGWQAALLFSVALPVVGLALTPSAVPARPAAGADDRRATPPPTGGGLTALTLYAFLMGGGVAVAMAFLPLYLVEVGGASVEYAGLVAALVGLTAIVFRVTWGWWSGRLTSYGRVLALLAAGSILSTLLLAAIGWTGLILAVPAALLFGATAATWNSLGMLAAIGVSGSAHAGRATGRVLLGFYFGFVVIPFAFGALVDGTGSYTLAWLGVAALFALAIGAGASVPRTQP